MCSPATTPEDDKAKGKWVRVDRDLNWKTGIWYLNLYYRRTRRLDVPLINDVLILPDGASPPAFVNLTEFTQAEGDLHSGVWNGKKKAMRMWYKTTTENMPKQTTHYKKGRREKGSRSSGDDWNEWDDEEGDGTEPLSGIGSSDEWSEGPTKGSSKPTSTSKQIITEIDVHFGDDQPWFGFERVLNGPVMKAEPNRWETVDVIVRRGNPSEFAVAFCFLSSALTRCALVQFRQMAWLHFSPPMVN